MERSFRAGVRCDGLGDRVRVESGRREEPRISWWVIPQLPNWGTSGKKYGKGRETQRSVPGKVKCEV